MRAFFFCLAAIFMFNMVYAQFPTDDYSKWRSPDGRNIDLLYVNRTGNIPQQPKIKTVGSPYEDATFNPGMLYNDDETFQVNLFARYNIMDDVIEIKNTVSDHDSLIKFLIKTPDLSLKIDEKVYDFVPFSGNIEDGAYFEILFRGNNVDLYKKHSKKFIEGRIARTSYEVDFPQRFVDENAYFFVTNEGKMIEFPSSSNKKLDVIPYKKQELNKYIKEKKLQINEEKDLINLIRYLDSLL